MVFTYYASCKTAKCNPSCPNVSQFTVSRKKITKEVISFAFTLVAKLIPLIYLFLRPPCFCFKHKTGVGWVLDDIHTNVFPYLLSTTSEFDISHSHCNSHIHELFKQIRSMNILIILLGIRADFAGYSGYFSRLQCIVSTLHACIIVQIVLCHFFSLFSQCPPE